MKTRIAAILLVVLMIGEASAVSAAPQRIAIKETNQATKERMAQAQIKNINLQDIEDPAARKAIQEILNYLGLQSQK